MTWLGVRTKKGRYIRDVIDDNTNSNESKNHCASANVISKDVKEVSE